MLLWLQVVDDWDIAEFVALPVSSRGPVVFAHHGPHVTLGWERAEARAPIATINSEPIDPKGGVVSRLRGESEKGAGGNWGGTSVNVPAFRKVYESAVCAEPLISGQHYVEVTWQEGRALWVGGKIVYTCRRLIGLSDCRRGTVVGPDFDPTIPRQLVQVYILNTKPIIFNETSHHF